MSGVRSGHRATRFRTRRRRLRWRRACSRSRAGRTAFSWMRRGKFSPLVESETDAGAAYGVAVEPGGDRPPGERDGDGGDDRPTRRAAAVGCSGVVEHGRGCVQAVAEGAGDDPAVEHGGVGEAAQGVDFYYVEADGAGAASPARSEEHT